ncbi:MAG: sugar transferase [Rhodopila sp.]|nr:sugar transferase [Rhodopila sp.]
MIGRSRASSRCFAGSARRGLDVVIAMAALIMVAPAMFFIALAIISDSPGPVFFSQVRLGRDGRPFRLHKFRKFYHRLDGGGCDVTLRNDARMTRVGRLLERTKLDEVPQLWNVLVGEMSIVGPRPESLVFADCFTGPFRSILDHTPGLLGPNQVFFRNEWKYFPAERDPHEFYRTVLFPVKARNDLAYFPQRSLRSDIVWIFRGVSAVFGLSATGEHGVEGTVDEVWRREDLAPRSDATALEHR